MQIMVYVNSSHKKLNEALTLSKLLKYHLNILFR